MNFIACVCVTGAYCSVVQWRAEQNGRANGLEKGGHGPDSAGRQEEASAEGQEEDFEEIMSPRFAVECLLKRVL